jgi:uncharacterized membrane protein
VVAHEGARPVGPPVTAPGIAVLACVLAAFCLWHAIRSRGVRGAAVFLLIALVTSWAFEEAGVVTGLVYGRYQYSATLGPWIGSVPVVIPVAWFALAYATSVVTDLVADRWPSAEPAGSRRLVGLALLGAGLMAGWDLVLDPILSGPVYHAWTWGSGAAGADVPLQNSLGWFVTALVIFAIHALVVRRGAERDLRPAPGARPDADRPPVSVGARARLRPRRG